MFQRKRIVLLASLILLALGTWASAQVFRRTPVDPPVLISGPNLGFEVTAHDGNVPVGRLVVRVDGRWVPVKEDPAPRLQTQQQ